MDQPATHILATDSPYDTERKALLDRLSLLSLQIAEDAGEMAQVTGIDIPEDYRLCCDIFSQMIRTHGLIDRLRCLPTAGDGRLQQQARKGEATLPPQAPPPDIHDGPDIDEFDIDGFNGVEADLWAERRAHNPAPAGPACAPDISTPSAAKLSAAKPLSRMNRLSVAHPLRINWGALKLTDIPDADPNIYQDHAPNHLTAHLNTHLTTHGHAHGHANRHALANIPLQEKPLFPQKIDGDVDHVQALGANALMPLSSGVLPAKFVHDDQPDQDPVGEHMPMNAEGAVSDDYSSMPGPLPDLVPDFTPASMLDPVDISHDERTNRAATAPRGHNQRPLMQSTADLPALNRLPP